MKKVLFLLAISLLALPFGCDQTTDNLFLRSLTYKTTDYDGRLAHQWINLTDQIIRENYLYAPQAARIFGYVGLTTWESVCNGLLSGKSMGGQINDFQADKFFDNTKVYDWGIVLCAAMSTVLPELIENINNDQRSRITLLAAQQESELMQKGRSEPVRQDSKTYGRQVGQRIVERLHKDGREVIRDIVPVIPSPDEAHKWYWDANTLGQTPVEPLWSTIRTFVVDNSLACEPPPPSAYSENAESKFFLHAQELYAMPRSSENRALAYHWEDGVGRTSSPAGHWMSIARQLLEPEGKNLAECAKTYCLVSLAVADCMSAAWFSKYKYFLLRPVTFIREEIDPSWISLVNTPPYPDYTSEAALLGGAGPAVLISLFGDVSFVDKTHLGSPIFTPEGGPVVLPERSFASLTQAGEEAAHSGMIGGTHFREACEEGYVSGQCIAAEVLSRLDFGF